MSTCKLDSQGRITVPASFRESQGLKPGQELFVLEEEGRLLIMTREQGVREAQAMVRKFTRPGGSAVEDLFKERRRQKAMEEREDRERERLHAKRIR